MKYLPTLHTTACAFLIILSTFSFYYSVKEEKKQKLKNEVNANLAESCIEQTTDIYPPVAQVRKSNFRIYKSPMEALQDNDISQSIDRAINANK